MELVPRDCDGLPLWRSTNTEIVVYSLDMSKTTNSDEMRQEYDFSGGVRGKHHPAYQQGSNVVLLDPDVAEVFKNSASVNHALRMLMKLADKELKRNFTKS